MESNTWKILSLTALLLISVSSSSALVIPYEGMEVSTQTTDIGTCEDGTDSRDTFTGEWNYQDISGNAISVRDITDEVTYPINLESRELQVSDYSAKTTHWIDTNVEEGDTVQTGQTQYTVESTSDEITIDSWGTVDAIRLEGEREISISATTRPENPSYQERIWYDSYSGLFLKRNSTANYDAMTDEYGWVSCELISERVLQETEQDTSEDGETDLEQILEDRESPLVKDVSLKIEVSESNVEQQEVIEVSASAEGVNTRPDLYLDGDKIAEGNSVSLSLDESGERTLEARQDEEEVNGLTYNYQDASTTVNVDKKEKSVTQGLWKQLTGFLGGILHSGDFNVKSLVVSPSEVQTGQQANVSVLVENSGDKSGERTYSLEVDGMEEGKKTVELDAGDSKKLTYTVERQETGTYSVSVEELKGELQVASGPEMKVESLDLEPAVIAEGETSEASVSISNTGGISGEREVELKVDEQTVESKTVYTESGQSSTVRFTLSGYDVGSHNVQVGNISEELKVENPAKFEVKNISVESNQVVLGDEIEGGITVENVGGVQNSHTVSVRAGDETVKEKEMTLGPNEETEVDFSINKDVIGEYNVTAGEKYETVKFKQYVWLEESGSYYNERTREVTEQDTFNKGDSAWAVFKYSIAKGDTVANYAGRDSIEIYGPDGDLIDSSSSNAIINNAQDLVYWVEIPTDSSWDSGEYTAEFQTYNEDRTVTNTGEVTFTLN